MAAEPTSFANANVEHSPHRRLLRAAVVSFVLLAAAAAALFYRQQITDQLAVWQFHPSTTLQAAADRAGLNETGKFYLYASQAQVVERATFNSACGSLNTEQTVVIGCYTSPGQRIYVYHVTDTQLDGVVEATTAHEMLHAAFDRLSGTDKQRITELLETEQKKITDTRLLKLIDSYAKTEPTELTNELHSIIGTEVRALSPELEAYYARYFANRSATVDLTERYEKVFADLEKQQDTLVSELDALAASTNARQTAYTAALKQLNADIASFNTWNQSGTVTAAEYSVRRDVLEGRIAKLETERKAINTDIDTYNSKKAELDGLNLKAQDLNQSINSKVSPTPSL